jgi:RHS repeat-associated protein
MLPGVAAASLPPILSGHMTEIVEWVYHNGALEDPEGCGEVCTKLVNAQRELNETSMTQRIWDELGALETSTDLWGSMAQFGSSLGQVELGPVPLRIGWRIRNRERMGSKWEEIIGPAEPAVKSPACEGKWGARFRATGEEVGGLNGEGTSEKQLSPGNEWYLRLCGTTERIYLETQAEGTENGEPCFGCGKPVPGWELHRYWWNVCFEGYNSHEEPIFRKNLAYLFYKQFRFSRPQEWTGQHLTGAYTYNIETGEEGSGLTEAQVREATERALAASSTMRYWIEWVLEGEHGTNPVSGPTSAEEYGGSTSESGSGKSRCMAGEPVNCATGNQVEQQTDLTVGGRGPGLKLTRTYNSQLAATESSPGPFGYGWVGTYSTHLEYNEELEEMTVTENDGSQVRFLDNGEQWVPIAPLVQSQLAREGSGWIYTLPNQTVLHFNSSGHLTSEVDRNGNTITITYNTEGRIETVSDASGRKLTYTYNTSHQVESIKDPMGHTVKYAYESGNLASVTLPGETIPRWKFKYNSEHEMTEKINGRVYAVKSEYNGSHRVVKQIDALERTRKWEYATTESGSETTITEPTGSVTVEKFNPMDQPVSVTHASGTPLAATTTHEYNVEGELIATTDPNGHTTKYSYDTGGDRTSETDPEGNTTEWTYDSTHDVLTTRRPDGELTTITRESHGNPESITRSGTGVTSETTKYKYDSHRDLESVTNPLEHTTSYEYDTYGDKTAETDPESDKRTWEYNEDSQQTATVSPRGHASGAEPSKFTTKTERDQQGRPIKITDPLGHTTKYTYDAAGNLETVTDGNSHKTTYTHDADNELTKTEEPNSTTTETGYDKAGQVTSETDGLTHTTRYVRNALEEVTEVIDPRERKTFKEYDKAGNPTKITDAEGRTTTITYTPDNRVSEASYSDGHTHSVKYEYNGDGKLTHMTDGTGETTYTYDAFDRLTESKNGHSETVAYEYNTENLPVKLTYPNSKAITRIYDKDGRLESVKDWAEHTTKFIYDQDSDLTKTTFPANEDKYTYNDADYETEVKMLKGSTTLASLAYTRDSDNQVKTITSKNLPGEEKPEYTYDSNNRLTKGAGVVFEYNKANSLTKIGSGSYAYNSTDELETGPSMTYTYNEVGQRTKTTPTTGVATTYSYDQAGNLTSVERGTELNDSYTYNGNDLRASQTISGTTTYLAWDEAEALPLLLSDGTNSYIYGPGGVPIEQINNTTNTVQYLHHDQQGSTRLLTGSTGAAEGKCSYSAYGIPTCEGTITTPLGYDSQYTSSDTDLIYLRGRVYDPATAQFLSRDPLEALTGEPYSYVTDNPLNWADPTGLSVQVCVGATASFGIFTFGGEVCYVTTPGGSGLAGTGSLTVGPGGGGNIHIGAGGSNASTPGEYGGPFVQTGGSATIGLGGYATGFSNGTVSGATGGATYGLNAETGIGGSETIVVPFSEKKPKPPGC